jgi:hypothetical protein
MRGTGFLSQSLSCLFPQIQCCEQAVVDGHLLVGHPDAILFFCEFRGREFFNSHACHCRALRARESS